MSDRTDHTPSCRDVYNVAPLRAAVKRTRVQAAATDMEIDDEHRFNLQAPT